MGIRVIRVEFDGFPQRGRDFGNGSLPLEVQQPLRGIGIAQGWIKPQRSINGYLRRAADFVNQAKTIIGQQYIAVGYSRVCQRKSRFELNGLFKLLQRYLEIDSRALSDVMPSPQEMCVGLNVVR